MKEINEQEIIEKYGADVQPEVLDLIKFKNKIEHKIIALLYLSDKNATYINSFQALDHITFKIMGAK